MTLGRAPDNDIVVTGEFVAAHHARIEPLRRRPPHRRPRRRLRHYVRRSAGRRARPAHGDVIRIGDPLTGSFVTLLYERQAADDADAAGLADQPHPAGSPASPRSAARAAR
jgi:hypothetical protein